MGAFEQVWKSVTGVPAVDMSTKRYTFVKYDANGDIVTPAAKEKITGVLYEPNGAGEPAQVVAAGFAFVVLGAAISPGTEVQTDASGQAVPRVEDNVDFTNSTFTPGGRSAGICVVGGAAGDIGTVLLLG